VIIGEVKFAQPTKFPTSDANAFDIFVEVISKDDPSISDWWRGTWSEDYGRGVVSHLKQKELTEQSLRKIGYEGDDLSKLPSQLKGKETVANTVETVTKTGAKFINVQSLGHKGGNAPDADKIIDTDKLKSLLMGGSSSASPISGAPNPFATDSDNENMPF